MSLVDRLTPKDTEEIKPGLFIQKTRFGNYRMISPAAWNGRINYKNLIFGPNFYRSLITFGILMFLVWSYQHDNAQFIELDAKIKSDPKAFCKAVLEIGTLPDGSLAGNLSELNISAFIITNKNGPS